MPASTTIPMMSKKTFNLFVLQVSYQALICKEGVLHDMIHDLMNSCRSPRTQRFMIRVYRNLALTTGSAALATALSMYRFIPDIGNGGFLASLALFMGIGFSRGFLSEQTRLALLLGFGFLQGWSIGPLTGFLSAFNPDALVMAVAGTALAFVSFTGAALFSPRRSYLYLGGLLTFAGLILLVTSFFPYLYDFNLYLGLFLLCFYIIYDTQVIVERAENRVMDSVDGAAQLFTDLFGILVRLMLILRDQGREDRDKRKKSKRK